jgi:hypothetical protein
VLFSGVDETSFSVGAASETDFAVAGVLGEEPVAGALAGVVVIEVDWVATVPTTSLSSPNSFHSSTCSRSWNRVSIEPSKFDVLHQGVTWSPLTSWYSPQAQTPP